MLLTNTQQLNRRKLIVQISFFLICFVCFLFFVLPIFANAAETIEGISHMNVANIKTALGLDSNFFEIVNDFSANTSKALSGIGALWVTAIMGYSVFKEFSRGEANLELWLKIFIKLTIGISLILFTNAILDGINQFGLGMVDLIEDGAHNTLEIMSTNNMEGAGILKAMGSGVIQLVGGIITAYIKIVCYTLYIEMGLRRIFAPLAVANIVLDGVRSSGFRFFKKYLSLYIKIIMIIGCVALSGVLMEAVILQNFGATNWQRLANQNDAVSHVGSGVYQVALGLKEIAQCFAIMFACTSFIGKASKLADEVVGVN